MKKYAFLSIVLLMILSAWAFLNYSRSDADKATAQETETLKIVLPEAGFFSRKNGTPPHYKAYTKNPLTNQKKLTGIAFLTTDVVPEIKGYAGEIKILVGINLRGNINKILILSHSETSSYVSNLEQFIQQFSGLGINSSFQLGEDIDGITKATLTSKAITRAVQKSLRIVASQVLDLEDQAKEFFQAKTPVEYRGITPHNAKYWKIIEAN